jgi:uncharacterized protein YggE
MVIKMEQKHGLAIVMALGLVIVSVLLALNTGKTTTQQDVLTVTGFAEESVMPDKAEAFITIETTKDTAKLSQDENTKISDEVMKSLKALGIKDSEIETDSYTIYPKEQWDDKNAEYKQLGYTVTNTLKVTTTDIQNVGKYVDAAVGAGANRVDRVVFALTKAKEKSISQDLLAKAGVNAKEKADTIAKSLGVTVGKVVTVSEYNYNVVPYYANANTVNVGGMVKADSTISPRTILTNAYITVSYKI